MPDAKPIYGEDYPPRRLLELIGDKWTPIVIYILGQGTRRYSDLQRQLPDLSKKMLTQTLRSLGRDRLLSRKVYAEVPPRVEYDQTSLGLVFLEQVTVQCKWATDYPEELNAAHANRKKAQRRKRTPPTDK
jgi:DNA-binding HxlR family transcriptional regulator